VILPLAIGALSLAAASEEPQSWKILLHKALLLENKPLAVEILKEAPRREVRVFLGSLFSWVDASTDEAMAKLRLAWVIHRMDLLRHPLDEDRRPDFFFLEASDQHGWRLLDGPWVRGFKPSIKRIISAFVESKILKMQDFRPFVEKDLDSLLYLEYEPEVRLRSLEE
jgi:hypothetical protein